MGLAFSVAIAAMRSIQSAPFLRSGFRPGQQAQEAEAVIPLDGGKGEVAQADEQGNPEKEG